ncbi:MAG: 3-oxoadipyl-CoA thiolase [SAR324 cluster bacterium]|jgi:3-oxoadipyl-CoA thiolase|nr:3-oxoadipyl-CoA thiolase [SAR324 cluster bacterium]MEE1577399.1 3-oxoadipyl-CoA thiolase [Deltaproteobacteria bacterium]MDP6245810.1 3-oxoadipyl-CoA thiolase [SAR324 cluster bacterium]MDP6330798.1 3-oxoadipyl-CoA thiolase [SAR324 cluster bacterium]MDP6638144.1 3-oxoadipyl-CoA thiolase [SAR324 cluster bacterium]|tara:strand:- start:955 stop:2160 length:1206 start_codon:yes stop_codon:yes gene_type:complete
MNEAFVCDAVRTPIGRYAGSLASVRPDDLAAIPIRTLLERNPGMDPSQIEDVLLGCANQAGEDNRNVARMALLLAGLPETVPGASLNRLCGSGMDAIACASRAVKTGEQSLLIAGGIESMSRAPFVIGKANSAFSRQNIMEDTTIGWRFINPRMEELFGTDSMPETAEKLAEQFNISREDQDSFAYRSQQKTSKAMESGRFAKEIVAVLIPRRKQDPLLINQDEHPRGDTTLEKLSNLPTPFRSGGSVTAGNASGVNDGAAALLIASESAARESGLEPRARILASTTAGVEPRIMGYGPVPAVRKLLKLTQTRLPDIGVIEINEAFASQVLTVSRELELNDDDPRINPNGGAIALGHPLGMSGARLVLTAVEELHQRREKLALCTMCIGVGQGISMLLERV